ncbi:hypothetical protein JTE90_012620, partial [Oedothorax gibbosus]
IGPRTNESVANASDMSQAGEAITYHILFLLPPGGTHDVPGSACNTVRAGANR